MIEIPPLTQSCFFGTSADCYVGGKKPVERVSVWPLHLQQVQPYPFGAQSSIAQLSQVAKADGLPATAGNSSMPVYQLDRSEEDWGGLCNQAIRRDDFWDPFKCVELGRPFGTSLAAQNCAVPMRSAAITTGASDRRIATATHLNRLISQPVVGGTSAVASSLFFRNSFLIRKRCRL